jgi:hypothetical protein
MYCVENFQTKKAVKEALAAKRRVEVYQPGPFTTSEPITGTIYIEGPHYPKPHRWYAEGQAKNGILVSIK